MFYSFYFKWGIFTFLANINPFASAGKNWERAEPFFYIPSLFQCLFIFIFIFIYFIFVFFQLEEEHTLPFP
jgi:hypothetical protein